jgi:hypothetical protein
MMPICPMSDLPRLLCACKDHNEWAFEEADLTCEERDYLAGKSTGQLLAIKLRKVIARPLPEYISEPWQVGQNVPVATGGDLCGVCGDRPAGDAWCCPECLDDARMALGDVPGLVDDLIVKRDRQDRVSTSVQQTRRASHTRWDDVLNSVEYDPQPVKTEDGVRMRRPAAKDQGRFLANAGFNRVPYAADAANILRGLEAELASSVRILAEPRGVELPQLDAKGCSRWLLTNLPTVALDPAGPDIVIGLKRTTKRAREIIDNADEGVYIGICDKCRTDMYADPERPEHRCSTCTAEYNVAERRAAVIERVRESLLSLAEIVRYSEASSEYFGERLKIKRVEKWVERKQLLRASTRPNGTGETALYRAGDVLNLIQRAKAS